MGPHSTLDIHERDFFLSGRPMYAGRYWRGRRAEGFLLNRRIVQGIFDDVNPETRSRWADPDGPWDAERNTRVFIAAMPQWRAYGLLASTLNLQGGHPEGYSLAKPWHNSAFDTDGQWREDYLARAQRILDAVDALGMAVILGWFYFGQAERLRDAVNRSSSTRTITTISTARTITSLRRSTRMPAGDASTIEGSAKGLPMGSKVCR